MSSWRSRPEPQVYTAQHRKVSGACFPVLGAYILVQAMMSLMQSDKDLGLVRAFGLVCRGHTHMDTHGCALCIVGPDPPLLGIPAPPPALLGFNWGFGNDCLKNGGSMFVLSSGAFRLRAFLDCRFRVLILQPPPTHPLTRPAPHPKPWTPQTVLGGSKDLVYSYLIEF